MRGLWTNIDPDLETAIRRRKKVDIETMRGEVIEHKTTIQMLKTAVADLQARVTKLEQVPNPHADIPVGQGSDPIAE